MNQPLANKPSEHSGSDPIEPVKLLMVEDDDFYYRLVSNILSTHHEPTFEVTRVSCLADAVKYLCLAASQIILLNLNLPDSAGLDTLLEVQKYSPGTPVIVLTGAEAHELGLRSIATGAADFLVKQKVGAESIVRCIRYAIERKKAEESRLRLLAIHDFSATLAHDLQIPMIGTNQVLDALLTSKKDELTSFQSQILVALKQSNTSQLELVQKLIEIYKYESGDVRFSMKSTDMKEIIVFCASQVEKLASEKGIVIDIKMADDLKSVWADREAMQSLVSSLIDNAIKFASLATRVSIEADNLGTDISLRLTNFGETISPEDQLQLFDRFWQGVRGKKYVASTGLGLYGCQQILRFHKGRIACSSSSREGTTFSVTIPGI